MFCRVQGRAAGGFLVIVRQNQLAGKDFLEYPLQMAVLAQAVAGADDGSRGFSAQVQIAPVHIVQLPGHALHEAADQMDGGEIVGADASDAAPEGGALAGALEGGAGGGESGDGASLLQRPVHGGVGALLCARDHFHGLAEEGFQQGVAPTAAQRRPHQQPEGPGFQSRGKHVVRGVHGNLAAGAHVHQQHVRPAAGGSQKGGLIVANGGVNGNAKRTGPQVRLRHHFGQQVRRNSRLFQSRGIEAAIHSVKQPHAGGIGGLHRRSGAACQLHGDVVGDGAESGGRFRDQTVFQIIVVGYHAIARGQSIPGDLGQMARPAGSLIIA